MNKSTSFGALRAIPGGVRWAQARVMLRGWFGVGHAITAFKDKALLADMARIWPFLQTMLGNMEMVLAKSDMALASRYAELVQDQEAAHAIFARIREGWQQTNDGLLAITGQSRLLDRNQELDRSEEH